MKTSKEKKGQEDEEKGRGKRVRTRGGRKSVTNPANYPRKKSQAPIVAFRVASRFSRVRTRGEEEEQEEEGKRGRGRWEISKNGILVS